MTKIQNKEKSVFLNSISLDYDGTIANSEQFYYMISTKLVADFYDDKEIFRNLCNINEDDTFTDIAVDSIKKYTLDVWNNSCAGDSLSQIHMQNLCVLVDEEKEVEREKKGKYYPKIFGKIMNFIYENRTNQQNTLTLLKNNQQLYNQYSNRIKNHLEFKNFLDQDCSEVFNILFHKINEIFCKYWFEFSRNTEITNSVKFRKNLKQQRKQEMLFGVASKSLLLNDKGNLLNNNNPDKLFSINDKKVFSKLPYVDMIIGFDKFFNNKALEFLSVVTSSASLDIVFKLLANIRMLEKLNINGKYQQAIDLLKSMLPSMLFVVDSKGQLTNKLKTGADIDKDVISILANDPCNTYVSYYKINRISYQDVENIVKIYLCSKIDTDELVKDSKLTISDYENNKQLFDAKKWEKLKNILDQIRETVSLNKNKPYNSYMKPNPTMHTLNLILRIIQLKKQNRQIDYNKVILTVIEDSGSIDAVSEIERAFGLKPSNISTVQKDTFNIKNDSLQKLMREFFTEIGLAEEYDKLSKSVVADGIYMGTGAHISTKNAYKMYSKNTNANFNTSDINDFFQRNKKMYNLPRAKILYQMKNKNKISRSNTSKIRNLDRLLIDSQFVKDIKNNIFSTKKILYSIFLKDIHNVNDKTKKKELYNNRKKLYDDLFMYKANSFQYMKNFSLLIMLIEKNN